MNHKIKIQLTKTIEDMYHSCFLALTQTDDQSLQHAIYTLVSYMSDKEEQNEILNLCVKDYVQSLIMENPDICDNDFETGMELIIEDKIQQAKDIQKDVVIKFTFEKNKKVFSTLQIKKLMSLSDIIYLLISTLEFDDIYNPFMIIDGEIFHLNELKDKHLFDFNLSKDSQFHIVFVDEDGQYKYAFDGTIEKEFKSEDEDIVFKCIKHGLSGPWMTKQEKADYVHEEYETEYLHSLFIFQKLMYDRPDLFDELDDELSNLNDLADQMFNESVNDDEIPDILLN